MPSKTKTDPTTFFWKLADPLLHKLEITEGTLMGFPCLRVDGDFFATCDHRTGDLIVKLSRERVQELIDKMGVIDTARAAVRSAIFASSAS